MERYWYVRDCDLFERLSPEETRRLELRSRTRSFACGTTIALPPDAEPSLFTLTAGRVWISRLDSDGRFVDCVIIEPGDLFGRRPFEEPESRAERLDVVAAGTVLQVPSDATQELLRDQSRIVMDATRWCGLRRERILRRLADLLFLSPREKLILWLLRMAAHHASPCSGGVRFSVPVRRHEIAIATGSTRRDIEEAWLDLRMRNELRYEQGQLLIVNLPRFENLVPRDTTRSPLHYAPRRSA